MAAIVEPEQQLPSEFEAPNSSVLQMALTALRLTALTQTVDLTGVFTRKRISLDEVANHDHRGSCWIVVYDRVYDITRFLREVSGFLNNRWPF
jgi:cytochrome b involved in lipid metabolism